MKWAAVACVTALLVAAAAQVGGRAGSTALAIVFSLLTVTIAMRLDARASALQAAQNRTKAELVKLREQNRDLREKLKANRAATAALTKQVSAAQSDLSGLRKNFDARLLQLIEASRESDAAAGLAALNRYTALATQAVNPPTTEEDDPVAGS